MVSYISLFLMHSSWPSTRGSATVRHSSSTLPGTMWSFRAECGSSAAALTGQLATTVKTRPDILERSLQRLPPAHPVFKTHSFYILYPSGCPWFPFLPWILVRARSSAASGLAVVPVRNPANLQMLRVNLQLSRKYLENLFFPTNEANIGKYATLRVSMLASEFFRVLAF